MTRSYRKDRSLCFPWNSSKTGSALIGILLLAAGLSPAVRADTIQANLVDASLEGAPGDTLAFLATLANPSDTDTIYLNGAGSTAASPFLSVDTSPFDVNAPLSLTPGEVSGPFELFDVTIDPSAPAGPYIGSFVSIQGGADAGQGTAFDDLADISFDVDVAGASPVPEPGTAVPISLGLFAIFAIARRRTLSR
jgi:hypothetical protein